MLDGAMGNCQLCAPLETEMHDIMLARHVVRFTGDLASILPSFKSWVPHGSSAKLEAERIVTHFLVSLFDPLPHAGLSRRTVKVIFARRVVSRARTDSRSRSVSSRVSQLRAPGFRREPPLDEAAISVIQELLEHPL